MRTTVHVADFGGIGFTSPFGRRRKRIYNLLAKHFGKRNLASLSISAREFPVRAGADLQRAIETTVGAQDRVVCMHPRPDGPTTKPPKPGLMAH